MPFPEFRPHPLLRNGHLQTIAGMYLPRPKLVYSARQHRVLLDDGDALVLHDDQPAGWQPADRSALLVHGLGGSHASNYMVRIAARLAQHNIRAFRLDLRGCGAGVQLARKPFHAGRSDDVRAAVLRIAEICPRSPVTLVGFSLGANIALKLAGELGGVLLGQLDRAIAIAPPLDLLQSCLSLNHGIRSQYDRALARFLRDHLKQRIPYMPELAEARYRVRPKRVIDFDEAFTAPLGGFKSARDYYAQSSAMNVLSGIRLPTVILAAADDPVVPVRIFDRADYSPSTTLHVTRHGGHLGYISSGKVSSRDACKPDADRRWLDWRVVEWISGERVLSAKSA